MWNEGDCDEKKKGVAKKGGSQEKLAQGPWKVYVKTSKSEVARMLG